jgi:hypothetical protein
MRNGSRSTDKPGTKELEGEKIATRYITKRGDGYGEQRRSKRVYGKGN